MTQKERLIEILPNAVQQCRGSAGTYGGWGEIADYLLANGVKVPVMCDECIYFHKAHVLCDDGTEKDISEFPEEAFGGIVDGYVTSDYGINVGSMCEIDKRNGYGVDKSVFRDKNDFCSRGIRRKNSEN